MFTIKVFNYDFDLFVWYLNFASHLIKKKKFNYFPFQLKVQYIDYGNTEEIQATGLLEIPPTVAAHKPLAYKLVLHNIMVKDVTDQNVCKQ